MNLLLMANQGLPRNGLVALYDPYRDTYRRNILPVGSENFVTGWAKVGGATVTVTPNQPDPDGGNNAYLIDSSGGTLDYSLAPAISSLSNPHTVSLGIWAKKVTGNPRIGIAPTYLSATTTWRKLTQTITKTEVGTPMRFGAELPMGASWSALVYQPQINLGSAYPYSPPEGMPQSAVDYTGHANNAQLGSTTGADTNDPKFNGVALVGDGVDDYAVVPLASAAYRISVVDSGSGFVVVDEVPAYLNLFKTGAATYLNGKIGPTAYYNRVPTTAEIAQAKRYFKRLMSGRGVTVS